MTAIIKKPSKLENLTVALARAQEALDAAKSRLQPQIETEQTRVEGLRKARDLTDKARRKAYETLTASKAGVRSRLFPRNEVDRLRTEIKTALGDRFPNADLERLVTEQMSAAVTADPMFKESDDAFSAAVKASEKAFRAWNIANSPQSPLSKMQYELRGHEDLVARLTTEIERLPRYRDAAKARRDDARAELLRDNETQAAREALVDFRFTTPKVTP